MKQTHLRLGVLGVVCLLTLAAVISPATIKPAAAVEALDDIHAPYVDKLICKVIEGEDQEALALLAGDIDIIGEQMDPAYVDQLLADPNIKMFQTDRMGYGLIILPCDTYPWNMTSFRRGLAYAFDKEEGIQDIWMGYASAQDSVIPSSQPSWSNEADLPDTYYESDIAKAIQLFNSTSGLGNSTTTDTYEGINQWWFEYSNDTSLEVEIWGAVESGIAMAYADLIAQNL
ncbi:MAG: ABC transporter substrate-binding protein, partial [Candidatus Ranarchaeia archaeon]